MTDFTHDTRATVTRLPVIPRPVPVRPSPVQDAPAAASEAERTRPEQIATEAAAGVLLDHYLGNHLALIRKAGPGAVAEAREIIAARLGPEAAPDGEASPASGADWPLVAPATGAALEAIAGHPSLRLPSGQIDWPAAEDALAAALVEAVSRRARPLDAATRAEQLARTLARDVVDRVFQRLDEWGQDLDQ